MSRPEIEESSDNTAERPKARAGGVSTDCWKEMGSPSRQGAGRGGSAGGDSLDLNSTDLYGSESEDFRLTDAQNPGPSDKIVQNSDGSVSQPNKYGGLDTEYPDGTHERHTANGDIIITRVPEEGPVGEPTHEDVETLHGDGSWDRTLPNGGHEVGTPDGSWLRTSPNGTIENCDADGNWTRTRPGVPDESGDLDGNWERTNPDGTHESGSADGSWSRTYPDGTKEDQDSDGFFMRRLPNGDVDAAAEVGKPPDNPPRSPQVPDRPRVPSP